jgi:hypothetical protein
MFAKTLALGSLVFVLATVPIAAADHTSPTCLVPQEHSVDLDALPSGLVACAATEPAQGLPVQPALLPIVPAVKVPSFSAQFTCLAQADLCEQLYALVAALPFGFQ